MTIYTDRSRIEAAGVCLRRRFWGWEYQGAGLERIGPQLDLHVGTAVHTGIEGVILGREHPVEDALAEFVRLTEGYAIPEGWPRQLIEKAEIAEALIHAWRLVVWPDAQQEYETLAVEREESASLGQDGQTITLMARPDWLVRRRADGAVFIINFKTVSRADKLWREQWRYDMQTFSEALAVEQRLGQPVAGTLIQGLLKGSKPWTPDDKQENPDPSRLRVNHNSPLIYCWFKAGEPPMTDDEFVALNRYEWSCTEPHDRCKGGATHRLGKGYSKVPVSEKFPGGIAAWIEHLAATDPALVRSQIIDLPPILRSPYEIERWKRQVIPREVEIHRRSSEIVAGPVPSQPPENEQDEQADREWREAMMDRYFPMNTQHGNCIRPGECSFLNVCFGMAAADPLESGEYRVRTPNHDTEALPVLVPTISQKIPNL